MSRVLAALLMAFVVLGVLSVAETAGATTGIVESGQITCHLKGTFTFSPKLTNSGAKSSEAITYSGALSHCSTTSRPAPSSGHVYLHLAAPLPNNSCGAILQDQETLPNLVGKAVWTASKTLVPSHLQLTNAGFIWDQTHNKIDFLVPPGDATSASTGSFAGPVTWPTGASTSSAGTILSYCRFGLSTMAMAPIVVTIG